MFPEKELSTTNYESDMKATPTDLRRSEEYLDDRLRILSLGGLGYGVLQGFKDSLTPSIQGNLLVVKSGAAIDKMGNLIYLPKVSFPIKDDLNIKNFPDKTNVYIYIRHDSKLDNLQDDRSGQQKVHHEKVSIYKVEVTTNRYESFEWIEIGRIAINYDKMSINNQSTISEPVNPFLPRENELDLRYVPRIKTNLMDIKEDDNEYIYQVLGSFADYLNEISFRYRLLSASTASSFVYQIREDIYTNITLPYELYKKLKSAIEIVYRIKDENAKIEEIEFWKNIERLRQLFSLNLGSEYQGHIDFNNLLMENSSSYFSKIFNHFDRASKCSKELDFEVEEEKDETPQHKGYVQVGRGESEEYGNDIVLGNTHPVDRSVSRVHAKIYAYKGNFMIEDLSALGTFVNGVKIEKGVQSLVKTTDEIILGRGNTKLNLNHEKIQELLYL